MRILIVGAGTVGFNLAEQLSLEGHDISVVEPDPAVARRINEKLDVLVANGSGGDADILVSAGIRQAEMVIAVTDIDELNMLICLLANHYGVKTKIARVRNEDYSHEKFQEAAGDLKIDRMISPEKITADSIMKFIETPTAAAVGDFADGEVVLRAFDVTSGAPLAGREVTSLRSSPLIVAIVRGAHVLIPRGEDCVEAGDRVFVMMAKEKLPDFLPLVNASVDELGKVVIYGATRLGCDLAERLGDVAPEVVLIESEAEKATDAAEELAGTLVLHGDGTDVEVLTEAGVEGASFFVAVSQDEESNLLASLLAKKNGAQKTIVVTAQAEFVPIIGSIGVDVVINPRLSTANAILQFTRRGRVRSVVRIEEGGAEMIELEAARSSKIVGRALRDVSFPSGAIIGALVREGQMVIPNGETVIGAGDTAIVFALPEAIRRIEKLF